MTTNPTLTPLFDKQTKRINDTLGNLSTGAPDISASEQEMASIYFREARPKTILAILSGALALAPLLISILDSSLTDTWKFPVILYSATGAWVAVAIVLMVFPVNTANKVALIIHQQRQSDLESEKTTKALLDGLERLGKSDASREPGTIGMKPTKDLNTHILLPLLAVAVALVVRKRMR